MRIIVKNRVLITYGLTLINLTAIILVSLLSTMNKDNYVRMDENFLSVIELMENISVELVKSEANVKNYLLTSENDHLNDFRKQRKPLEDKLKALEEIYKNDLLHRSKFLKMKELIFKEIFILESCIQIKKNEGIIQASDYLKTSNKEKCLDQIKWLHDELIDEQKKRIRKEQSKVDLSYKSREYIVISAGIASLLISVIAIGMIVRDLNLKIDREKQLEDINANKDRFFSLISHDLKGPAQNLILLTDMLLHDKTADEHEKKELVVHLNSAAKKNNNLLESLLEWSKLQMGTVVLKPELIDLWHVCQETFMLLDEKAYQKEITLVNKISKETLAYADYNGVCTVMRNLVSNALKYTPRKGRIEIYARVDHKVVILTVRDNGIGLDPNTAKTLFKAGKQISREGTEGEKGTGIGLLLCQEFVEKNHGTIWAESEEGKGATFRFTLPRFKR